MSSLTLLTLFEYEQFEHIIAALEQVKGAEQSNITVGTPIALPPTYPAGFDGT
jgi:hypothetical protein